MKTVIAVAVLVLVVACAENAEPTVLPTASSMPVATAGLFDTPTPRPLLSPTSPAAPRLTSTPSPTPAGPATGAFSRALRLLPDRAEVRGEVHVADYALGRRLFEVDLPPSDAPGGEVLDYVIELFRGRDEDIHRGLAIGSSIDGFTDYSADPEGMRAQAGFTAAAVDLSVMAGQPPLVYEVLQGRFDLQEVDHAVRTSGDVWEDRLEEESYRDVDFYSWGDVGSEPALRLRSLPLRPFGRPHNLRATGDSVSWVLEKEQMRELIDVSLDRAGSLASVGDFRDLAAVMDREGVYAGFMTDRTPGGPMAWGEPGGYGLTDTAWEELQRKVDRYGLDPYNAYGIGATYDGQHYYLVIALVYGGERDAEDNADGAVELIEEGQSMWTETVWSELLRLPEAHTDGRVLVVKARTDRPLIGVETVLMGDPILYHR